jgi:ABC-type nitrate/sulfonate/bicarbonate transport system permease component
MSALGAADAARPRTAPVADDPPTTMEGAERGRWWERLDRRTTAIVLTIEALLILFVWQVAVGTFKAVNPVFLPPPLKILDGFATLAARDDMATHLGTSLYVWLVGFALAVVVGVALGVITGASLPVDRLTSPVLWTIYATPWLAYRPLSVVWFGFGLAPIIFLVFIASLFPVLLNTAAGVRSVDPSLIQASRVFGISRLRTYWSILLPSALPFVIVGMRQSAVMATISLIVAEMLGSSVGIGAQVAILTSRYQTGQAFALVIVMVLWTVVIGQLLKAAARRVAPWQTDARSS